MKRTVEKPMKVALCRCCRGTGKVEDPTTKRVTTCSLCEGSGRVEVSAVMEMDIRPYKPDIKK